MGIYIEGLEAPKTGSIRIQLYDNGTVWVFQGFGWERQEKKYIDLDFVRCVECKHYNGHEEYCEIDHFARENGFCSSGKRRADYTVFTVNPPKGIETPLKGDATVFHKNSNMGEKVTRPTATSSTEVPWWIKGE